MLMGGLESAPHSLCVLYRPWRSFFANMLGAELGEKVNERVARAVWMGCVCRGSVSHHTSYLAVQEPV